MKNKGLNSRRWQGQKKSRCEKEWRAKIETEAVLRIRDVYLGSRIQDSGSDFFSISDPGSRVDKTRIRIRIKKLSIFNTKN